MMELVKTSTKVVKSEKPIVCPDCRKGYLQRLQPAFVTSPVYDYDSMISESKAANIDYDGTPYIACTECDFMGSPNDVIVALKVKETVKPVRPMKIVPDDAEVE